MLSIPNLPTDNLYKFLFIAGVVSVIASFFLLENSSTLELGEIKSLDSLNIALKGQAELSEREVKKSEYEWSLTKIKIQHMENKLTILDSLKDYGTERKKLTENLHAQSALIKIMLDTINVQRTRHIINNMKMDFISSEREHRARIKKHNITTAIPLFILGLFLSVSGGLFWYFKTQQIQDNLLKMQLEIVKLDYKEKLKASEQNINESITEDYDETEQTS